MVPRKHLSSFHLGSHLVKGMFSRCYSKKWPKGENLALGEPAPTLISMLENLIKIKIRKDLKYSSF
jgi:hypothetical protein